MPGPPLPRRLTRAWVALRGRRTRRVSVAGHEIIVPPGVLDPVAFRTGAAWAPWVAARVAPGVRLLDLGCGTGVVGALAQAAGARVTAIDLDPRAVAAARANGLADARRGDLFRPVLGERFDRVAFNPPFLPGWPGSGPYGLALYGGPRLEVLERFAAGAPRHLAAGGVAWALLSDRCPWAWRALGPGWDRVHTATVGGGGHPPETLSVWARGPG